MNELSCVTLRKVDPSKNMARQYSVAVCQDLFETAVVVCRWGRICRAGRSSQHVCGSLEEAQALAEELVEKRRGRGYGDTEQPDGGGARLSLATAPPRASAALQASATRRQRAKRPATGQLWLLDWAGQKTSPPAPQRRAPTSSDKVAGSLPSDDFALMRTLGKPGTHADRERAIYTCKIRARAHACYDDGEPAERSTTRTRRPEQTNASAQLLPEFHNSFSWTSCLSILNTSSRCRG
jgi:predicted DNA-binding WGR domain protein